ncbi:MAG: NAD(P)/FAD-dependent oxidoreductase [Verrucomicrobiota bacterium]
MNLGPVQHVVIIGGGFGGLACGRKLARRERIRVTLIDRQNHHLFQPLLYQVATATLTSPDIARSIRSIFPSKDGIDVRYDEVSGINLHDKTISLSSGESLSYDAVVIATGARTSFFGNNHWAPHVHQLKSLRDAIDIRKEVLRNLEFADQQEGSLQDTLSTVVIVGGGPTGVELAGAFSDLVKRNMKRSFRRLDTNSQRILLLEGQERLLGAFDPEHSTYAANHLQSLGVDVRTQAFVEDIQHQQVTLQTGETISAATIIWTAGVEATPLTRAISPTPALTRGGLVKVAPDLSIPGFPSAFVIGDSAFVPLPDGSAVPGVAPAATQAGEHVAELIATTPLDEARHRPFKYLDKGKMAIVGKGSAVVQIKDWKTQGWLGWLIWLFIHVLFLVDFRSKVGVLLAWFYAFVRNVPGARVFTASSTEEPRIQTKQNDQGEDNIPLAS